ITRLATAFGSQAVVCAIDTAGGKVFSRAGTHATGRDVVQWAEEAEQRGAGELLLTSIATDGTRDGYDVQTTAVVASAVGIPVIASGGAGNAAHIAAALQVAQAALLASILHDDPEGLPLLRAELKEMGVELRDVG
ncbi:MAG: imidazole glycerol-phosphate synthase subunit HisF, partial [Actinomycetota bacterium]|nr:imidazole glycerol-phosphate synthase subunit HisF [Actinomycetota bacterium]